VTPCRQLEQNLPLVRRVIATVCLHRCLFGADAEDTAQEVLLKLLADDCADFAGFRGESSLETFVSVVTMRACIDEIRRRRGRWRPSTASRRLGFAAVCLEELVYRDGLSFEEAVAKLLAEGVVGSREALDEVWPQIPARSARVFIPQEDAPEPVASDDPERQAEAREREAQESRRSAALDEVLSGLPPEDRFIVRRLFYDGRTVAEVAREVGIDQRPLYRRRDKLLEHLRRELEKRGFKWPE
jgi:RNA polymerase sigma factor (sigma-70 family)